MKKNNIKISSNKSFGIVFFIFFLIIARIQTVHKETNRKYYDLIKKFKEKTKCPILINTSFNVRGEPIVNTTIDAFNCFMGTNLDKLVIGNCYLDKKNQNKTIEKEYKNKFELD